MSRVQLQFTRIRKIIETGIVSVDLDAGSQEELVHKLDNREFASFIPLDSESADDQWAFRPLTKDAQINGQPSLRLVPSARDTDDLLSEEPEDTPE